ncbi:NUDIX hydrolase [Amaricoccus sp.]|uniref:NUDIX hydrolase n=1 Tax=Amaricoccus sp. TaxID=1872485 RepID=UPI0026048799|nr:NUDIX hydrolase [Amaricoccus sp.]HRO11939.1 NUDIX hydrolase [Amaricoccus sp.]
MRPASEAGPAVRDAATVILLRRDPDAARVLMGQRGGSAAFMPDKFVFPGGAVDPEDGMLPGGSALDPLTERRLGVGTPPGLVASLARAAVRELWEETGLMLGRADPAAAGRTVPQSWRGFYANGLVPHTAALRFVFRAITPRGRPRRFDARFFLVEAGDVAGDSLAPSGDELSRLQWLTLAEARALPLPFITEVVLSEVEALVADPDPARPVPFFHQAPEGLRFSLL